MFNNILLAYDGSEHAQNALKVAAGLAKTHVATLHLVHTPQVDTPPIVIGSYVSMLEVPPSKEDIEKAGTFIKDMAIAEAKAEGVDGVCSVGGGSSLDTAKLIAVLMNSDQPIGEMYGVGLVTGGRLPMVLAPTTAAVGCRRRIPGNARPRRPRARRRVGTGSVGNARAPWWFHWSRPLRCWRTGAESWRLRGSRRGGPRARRPRRPSR